MVGAVVLGMDGKRLKYGDLIRNNGLDSGSRGQAPWNGTRSTTTDCLDWMQGDGQCVELIYPATSALGTRNAASGGSSIKDARKPKPVTRLEPLRVEPVRSTYQPSKAEREEPIVLPQLPLEVAAHGLMEPVETHHIDKPRRES